jgi:hypothetical protein
MAHKVHIQADLSTPPNDGDALVYDSASQSWLPTAGGGGGGVTDHGALTGLADDDHPQYHNNARGDARYYTESEVDTFLAGKSDTGHTHVIADVTGLQTALDSKSSVFSGTSIVTIPTSLPRGRFEHEETVAATGITGSMKIIPSLAPHLDTDENSEDMLDLLSISATPSTAQITFKLSFSELTSGPIKINYLAV